MFKVSNSAILVCYTVGDIVDRRFEYDGWEEYYNYWRHLFVEYKYRTKTKLEAMQTGSSNEQEFRNTVYDKLLLEYKQVCLLVVVLYRAVAGGKYSN